ncbi:MAG: carboxypeptidase-like regulatory domain-containing protein [Bacteroidota bacterium]
MKNLIITIVLIMSLGTAIAGNEKEINTPVVSKTASVSGKIVDVKTGESVAGACVTVLGTEIKVYTDLDGNYSISNLNSGAYVLNVNMISYKATSEIKINASAGSKVDKNILIEPEF